jgi:hypothetical protein
MKLVLIEWMDSHAGSGWLTKQELESAVQPMFVRSVGWLFSKDRVSTVIVPHCATRKGKDAVEFGRGDLSIPSKAILRTVVLRKS